MTREYTENGMILLRYAIVKQSFEDYKAYNHHSEFCYLRSLEMKSPKRKETWNYKSYGYANEMIKVLVFILSDWYKKLTEGKSPQVDIYKELLSSTQKKRLQELEDKYRI